jgi:hypothetical protein
MQGQGEVRKLNSLVRRYRLLVIRLVAEGMDYTAGEYCVFCSGQPGAKAADDTPDGKVKHSRLCPINQALKLALEEV